MKPNFALSLSFDGIRLLRRAYLGWHPVGEVALDVADMPAALAALRDTALDQAPAGLTTKLVIPNDQIKYVDLPIDDSWSADKHEAVRAALLHATPYDISELVYDWSVRDDRIQIAAVARETLAEAEAFAVDNAFSPVSFVAIPDEGRFAGEPFFGETSVAAQVLPKGEKVERDMGQIRVIATPEPEPEPVSEPEPTPVPEPEPTPVPVPKPEPEPEPTTPDEPAATFGSIRAKRGDAIAPKTPDLEGPSRLTSVGMPADDVDGMFATSATSAKPPSKDSEKLAEAAPIAPGLPTEDGTAPDANDTPPAPVTAVRAGFASRRTSAKTTPEADAVPSIPGEKRAGKSSDKPLETPDKPAKGRGLKSSGRKSSGRKTSGRKSSGRDTEKQRLTVFGAREQVIGGKPRFLGLILTAVLLLFLVGVAAWASIFLDEGLASLFGGSRDVAEAEAETTPDPDDPITLAISDSAAIDRVVEATQEDIDAADTTAALDDTPLPDLTSFISPDDAQASYAVTGIWQMAPMPPDAPSDTPGGEPLAALGLTGFDQPPARAQISTLPLQLAALTDVQPVGATGPVLRTDADVSTPDSPDIEITIDPPVLVTATTEGALSPDGIVIFAGRPEAEPPRIMARETPLPDPEPQPESQPELLAETQPETLADQPALSEAELAARAQLAAFRPRQRPEGLVPEPEPEAQEEIDPALLALAELRPRLRPVGFADLTPSTDGAEPEEASDAGGADADTGADTATDTATDSDAIAAALAAASTANIDGDNDQPDRGFFENATAQAVKVSLTPAPRPSGFAAKVKAARDAQSATAVSAAQVLAPSLPTTASVARQATEKNVINLRKVNLIGVYGAPSSRRALVRLGNGRYKKVKVGDRLDGGKVAAIGDAELRYVKRGKNVLLQMPKG